MKSHAENFEANIQSSTLQKVTGRYLPRLFSKTERGIIILENQSIESSTISSHQLMKGRDRRQIMGINEAKGAMVALATFHGILWRFYRGHCSPALENQDQSIVVSTEDVVSYLSASFPFSKFFFKATAKSNFKAVKLMIENYFPGQRHLCPKIDSYASTRLEADIRNLFDTTKTYFGICHFDLDGRNILVNQAGNKVMLIDFQTFQTAHLSQDFWDLLYSCTDRNFRKLHLDTCFETYFETLKNYIGDHVPDMNLNILKREFQELRLGEAFCRILGKFAFLLSPVEETKLTFSSKKMDELASASFNDEKMDETMMDLRIRVLDVLIEASDLDLI